MAAVPPERHWSQATPASPAGIPIVIVSQPPITRSAKPIPGAPGIPLLGMYGALDLVLDLGLCDRRAKVIFGLDRGRDFFAQHDRLGRGIHGHFEFRFFVFFHAETAAAVV